MHIINNKDAFQEAREKKVYFPQVEDNFELLNFEFCVASQ